MTKTQEPRHIRINAHDDEVVIYAGQAKEEDGTVHGPASEAVAEAQVQGDDTARSGETAPPASKDSRDEYRATTLEDLNSSKMSTTQKVIIVLAVISILAFIIWYAILT